MNEIENKKFEVTGNSARSDCYGCGKILRGSKEVDYCETCMIQRELAKKDIISKFKKIISDEIILTKNELKEMAGEDRNIKKHGESSRKWSNKGEMKSHRNYLRRLEEIKKKI